MHRIESAILQNRCVFALGDGFISENVQRELASRNIPSVSLTDDTLTGIQTLSTESLAPAFNNGIIVILDPSLGESKLEELASLIGKANPRPQLFIISKAYNRFGLPLSMLGWKLQQIKQNGLPFIRNLSKPKKTDAQARPAKKKAQLRGPQVSFLGRKEEVAQLTELLSQDGSPIFITGPNGIGKRWLLEHTLADLHYTRIPEINISGNFQADAFLGRLAEYCASFGNNKLLKAISAGKNRPTPSTLIDIVVETIQTPTLKESLFVLSGLEHLINFKESYFYREGFFELLLQKLFVTESPLRIVFLVNRMPSFLSNLPIRQQSIAGLGKEHIADFMSAWQVPELTEEQQEDVFARTHGHPTALRHIAITLRNTGNADLLAAQSKFGQLSSVSDTQRLKNFFKRRLDKLSPEDRSALEQIALFQTPVSSTDISSLGLNRKFRIGLVRSGVLEQSPNANHRLHYLNPLLRSHLKFKKVYDFDRMEELGDLFLEKARTARPKGEPDRANPLAETVAVQEANALFLGARKRQRCWTVRSPFCDPITHSIRDLLFGRDKPIIDVAWAKLRGNLKNHPNHPDLLLLEVLAMKKDRSRKHDIDKAFVHLHRKASVPESYHQESNYHLERNAFDRAIKALRAGCDVFPQSSQLFRRVAGLLVRQGQISQANSAIETALSKFPNNPEYHSLHGEILTRLGKDYWEQAQEAYTQSRQLYHNIPAEHLVREAELLRVRSMVDLGNQKQLLEEAEKLLRESLRLDKSHTNAQISLACVLLDLNSDEHKSIEKLLSNALKRRDRSDAFVQKARLLIRQGKLTDVESHLDRAFKLARKNHQLFTIRGEYYLATNEPLLALKAFQKAMDTCPPSTPEHEVNKRYIEQVSMIIAANSNVDYSSTIPTVSTIPALEQEAAPQVLRRPRKDD